MVTKLGGSQLLAEPVGRFSRARTSHCQTSFPSRVIRRKETTVGTSLLSRLDAAETPHLPSRRSSVVSWSDSPRDQAVSKKCGGSHGGLHGVSSGSDQQEDQSKRQNCVKFSRTCQMNTNRSSTVTVSRQKCSRWMMRKLLCWQPRGNSCRCKVGLRNKRNTWSEFPGRLRRNNSIVWKFYKNGSRLIRNWMQHMPNRSKLSTKCRFWFPNRPQKMRKLSIRARQESSHSHHLPTQTLTHNRPSSQRSNLFSRCKTWGVTALLNSSWQLERQMRKSRQ